MREIKLTNTGEVALVDDEDYERFGRHSWYRHAGGRVARGGKVPVRLRTGRVVNKPVTLYLHREITGVERGDKRIVVHRDGDHLNNTRQNLRIATRSQVMRSWTTSTRKSSRFRGLSRYKNKWVVRITAGPRVHYLGYFPLAQEEAAARVYDDAALALHGEYAILNFPDGPENEEETDDSFSTGRKIRAGPT